MIITIQLSNEKLSEIVREYIVAKFGSVVTANKAEVSFKTYGYGYPSATVIIDTDSPSFADASLAAAALAIAE